MAGRVHADGKWGEPELGQRTVIERDVRREPPGLAADDREHEREAVARGPYHRRLAPADTDPRSKRARFGRRKHPLPLEWRAGRASPRHRLALVVVRQERGEEVEFLLEQRLVLVEVVAEQRERLGERATPENHLRATARRGVEGGEPLEDANRVVGTEHRHRRAEPYSLRPAGDGREQDFRRRDGEVGPVVLADAEEVNAHRVGQLGFGNDVADDPRLRECASVTVDGDVAEGVQAEFEGSRHRARVTASPPTAATSTRTARRSYRRSRAPRATGRSRSSPARGRSARPSTSRR